MPSYILSSLIHLVLLAGSGAFAFLLIQDKATLSSYLPMAGAGLALLSLLLTFVRRRQCTLARDTSNDFRASPLVTLFLRLTALLLLVYTAASIYLALLMFGVMPVPGFLGPPAAIVGESAVAASGVMQRMSSPGKSAANRIAPTQPSPAAGRASTATPNTGARQLRVSQVSRPPPRPSVIVSRTVPNVPIVLSSPTPNKLNRRQAGAPKSSTSASPPIRTPAPRSNGAAATPIRIAGSSPTSTNSPSSSNGGQLAAMNNASTQSPKLVLKILAMAQGALGLLAMGAVVALPVPLERVGTDSLPPMAAMNNAPPPTAGKPAFQPGLGEAADATMYSASTGTRSLPGSDTKPRGQSPRMLNQSPRMALDSVASFNNGGDPNYGSAPPPFVNSGYYAQPPLPAPVDPAYYPTDQGPGYYPGPPGNDFPPQPSYADTLPMTAAAGGFRSPPPQFYDNPAYAEPPQQPPRRYNSPYPAVAAPSPVPSSRRPSQDSRGTFASNRLYQDGFGAGNATPSVGTRSAGVPSVGGPGDYASDTLRSGFSLRNVNPSTVPGMQERGVGRVPRGGVGVERTRVEPKRAVARTMYLSDEDE